MSLSKLRPSIAVICSAMVLALPGGDQRLLAVQLLSSGGMRAGVPRSGLPRACGHASELRAADLLSHGVQPGGGDKLSADHDGRSVHGLSCDVAFAGDDVRAAAGCCSLHDISPCDHDGANAGSAGMSMLAVCDGRLRSRASGGILRTGRDSRLLCANGARLRRHDN